MARVMLKLISVIHEFVNFMSWNIRYVTIINNKTIYVVFLRYAMVTNTNAPDVILVQHES